MIDDGPICLVLACDDAYAQHAHVTITSAIISTPNYRLSVFVLVPNDFKFADKIEVGLSGQCDLHLLRVPAEMIGAVKVSGHVSETAYFRILIGRLLPIHIERVIYLDSDIVVNNSIHSLWHAELSDNIAGAVVDQLVMPDLELKSRLGLTKDQEYFNSGVMLIDLVKWRKFNVGDEVLHFCNTQWEMITWWDQCALNHVLRGRVLLLDDSWNFQQWYPSERKELFRIKRPHIIHFVGKYKPWAYFPRPDMSYLYWDVLLTTPWRDYVPQDRNLTTFLRKWVKPIIPDFLIRFGRHLKNIHLEI